MIEDLPSSAAAGSVASTEHRRIDFLAAYDAVLATWPVAVECIDVRTAFGVTRVHVCGPAGGTPLVLLHGGGTTSTVWFANVEELSRTHRVHAVDLIGDVGRSIPGGQRIGGRSDLMDWLDEVFDQLGLETARLCGHSYGGWLALSYAIQAPHRVSQLALLDPTECFTGLRPSYRLHAVPLFTRPNGQRMRAFLHWETDGRRLDPAWLDLVALGSELPSKIVFPRRPTTERLRATAVPTLVLLAEQSKAHNVGRLAHNARQFMPDVTITVLAGASHHSIPTEDPEQLNRELTRYFT